MKVQSVVLTLVFLIFIQESSDAQQTRSVSKIKLSTGVTLEVAESGDPDGKPVIFLHGFTDSRHSFDYVVPNLPTGIRAMVITQRGHGNSDKPQFGYTPDDFAADLQAFMAARNLTSAIIVGHSMGSIIAEVFALKFPGKVSGLVLLGTIPNIHSNPGLKEFGAQVALLKDPVDHAFASDFQNSTISIAIPQTYLDTVINESLKVPSLVWKSALRGLLNTDLSDKLKQIKSPVLIVFGEKDNLSSVAEQQKLQASIAGSRLIIYKGLGHAFHWEDPVQTAADLTAFVNEIAIK